MKCHRRYLINVLNYLASRLRSLKEFGLSDLISVEKVCTPNCIRQLKSVVCSVTKHVKHVPLEPLPTTKSVVIINRTTTCINSDLSCRLFQYCFYTTVYLCSLYFHDLVTYLLICRFLYDRCVIPSPRNSLLRWWLQQNSRIQFHPFYLNRHSWQTPSSSFFPDRLFLMYSSIPSHRWFSHLNTFHSITQVVLIFIVCSISFTHWFSFVSSLLLFC